MPFNTPVLLLIFCRKEPAQKVFEQIRLAKPKKLYIAADGARTDRAGEAELCEQTRSIVNQVDWECEVKTLFRDTNLGCKKAVTSAIDWFFEHENEGIILEDDCVPNPSFFAFCSEMLEKYRNDTRIFQINGSNFQNGRKRGEASYYFSKFNHVWGWATWKRAWELMDIEMQSFPEFKAQNKIADIFENKYTQKLWIKHFSKIARGVDNIWDAQWTFSVFKNNGLCITPNANMITNIGFNVENAVNSGMSDLKFANKKLEEIDSITHPTFILPDKKADDYINKEFGYTFTSRINREIKRIFQK